MTTDDKSKTYYSITPDGVELHCSAKEAAATAASWLEPDGEWHEDTALVEWGILTTVERAVESDRQETPGGEFDYTCTYTLTPVSALVDPSAPHTPVNAATFTCEGFPRPLTQADIDALYKRAIDAEDHLRREVASNQALVADVKRLQAWCTDDATVLRLSASNDDLRARFIAEKYLADEASEIIKARDQTIADLQALLAKCVPPGYSVGNAEAGGGYLVTKQGDSDDGAEALFGGAAWGWNADWSMHHTSCGDAATRDEAMAALWSHYHAHPRRED